MEGGGRRVLARPEMGGRNASRHLEKQTSQTGKSASSCSAPQNAPSAQRYAKAVLAAHSGTTTAAYRICVGSLQP